MNKQSFENKGFTLLEILIAILIFALVMSILFASFKAFIISSEKVKKEVAFTGTIRSVFKRIHMDIESIAILQPPRYKKPQFNTDPDPFRLKGTKETLGQQVVSTLFFPSFAHTALGRDKRDGVAQITYYLKEKENYLYDLLRSDVLWPFPKDPESCADPVLCRDISGFNVTYIDAAGEEYDTWDSDDPEFKYTFPASIDIKIIFGTGDKTRIFEMAVFLFSGRMPIE